MPQMAYPGPYVDQSRTTRNQVHVAIPRVPPPIGFQMDSVRQYYATDRLDEGDTTGTFLHRAAPPHASNSWQPGHDLYANGGNVTGQNYVGVPPPPAPGLDPGEVMS